MLVDGGVAARTVALVLAQDPAPGPGQGEEFGKASPVGLVVIILLGIATVFLIRSMTRHLRRVPESFDPPSESPEDPHPDTPPGDLPTGDARTGDVDASPER